MQLSLDPKTSALVLIDLQKGSAGDTDGTADIAAAVGYESQVYKLVLATRPWRSHAGRSRGANSFALFPGLYDALFSSDPRRV